VPETKTFVSWSLERPDHPMVFTHTPGEPTMIGSDGAGYSLHIGVEGTPEESIRKHRQGYELQACDFEPGEHHPRMYRGSYKPGAVPMNPQEQAEFAQASEQEDILLQDLRDITRVIAPDLATHAAYGSRIRNLLIMACTEIEAQWRGILTANGYPTPSSGRFNTVDYVKLCRPLRLADYALRCTRFRDYPPVCPFEYWDAIAPTQTLAWYDAYNATKHDRMGAFSRATLENAIDASAALCILLIAQYGTAYLSAGTGAFFAMIGHPKWEPRQRFHKPMQGAGWVPVLYSF
jgi:hypothetical protein